MEPEISVLEIERFAVHDGPGIRTVVFMQGCPLHCPWCANPESQSVRRRLRYSVKSCVRCGGCAASCPSGNIVFTEGRPAFGFRDCIACGRCVEACPQGAIRFSSSTYSASQVLDIVLRDKDYYDNSGGGVTFSGGEAFLQFDGLMEMLRLCKERHIHTAVETCGQVAPDRIRQALPWVDLFLFDVKHTVPSVLKQVTGADFRVIETNLRFIAENAPHKVIVRVPVIPGFNFDTSSMEAIFSLLAGLGIRQVHLLPYHTLGVDKYAQLGMPYPYPHTAMLTKEELRPLYEKGRSMGLDVRLGG